MGLDSAIVYFHARSVFTCGCICRLSWTYLWWFISSRASREDVEVYVQRVSLEYCRTPLSSVADMRAFRGVDGGARKSVS